MTKKKSVALQILEYIFNSGFKPGSEEVPFSRDDIIEAATKLGLERPKNIGGVLYYYRYSAPFPGEMNDKAPAGKEWVIEGAGSAKYKFVAKPLAQIHPSEDIEVVDIPDATPGLISKWAQNDEQALLAILRYNRLIDIFSGVTCYSLQNHLRTAVTDLGQVETDEIYIGIDDKGVEYVFPVQAKGGRDKQSSVQIEQDIALCEEKFSKLVCRPIAAQFIKDGRIALFDFEVATDASLKIRSEKHYRLVKFTDNPKEA